MRRADHSTAASSGGHVSEILGHSSIAITGNIYRDVSPTSPRQAIDLLGDALDR